MSPTLQGHHRSHDTMKPSSSRDAASVQIAHYAAFTDMPSSSDLSHLTHALKDRSRALTRRIENVRIDEQDVLFGEHRHGKADGKRKLLQDILDSGSSGAVTGGDADETASARLSRSPSILRRELSSTAANSKLSGKLRHSSVTSPPPSAHTHSNSIASPNSNEGHSRQRIKVKRETERDQRERSAGASSVRSGTGAGSPGLDADWDDDGPSRPGRTYFNKRKRHRAADGRDESPNDNDASLSELGSPRPNGSRPPARSEHSSSHVRRESIFSTSGAGQSTTNFKLKLNPTAQTAMHKRDSISANFLRRPSGLRGDDLTHLPLTPFQIQQAAMWELPKRTAETFIPQELQPRPIRPYPTKPDEVDVDFSSMDWRERDKERDRLEAAAAAAAAGGPSTGPAPGQAVVKETAMSRARDRKQDQVAFHTFQQWCDGWFRTLTEEDLAWLSSKSEDLEPFNIPVLGRYYREVWDDEEAKSSAFPTVYLPNAPYSTTPLTPSTLTGRVGEPSINGADQRKGPMTSQPGNTPAFDPRQLKDDHLFSASLETVRSGPFTERLLAALLPTPPPSEPDGQGSQANHSSSGSGGLVLINGHGGGNTGVSQDMANYEERLMRELKAIDVIGAEGTLDWSERTDDEISSTLRKVQRLLRKQIRINEGRKNRLFEIAMDRMAYQDYVACLTSVEREIEAGWLRRQTQIRKSMQAQKKKKGGSSSSSSGNAGNASSTAATGASGAAVAAAAAIGDLGAASAASPAAAGTPGNSGGLLNANGSAMLAQGSSQGFVPENRGGGPIKPQFSEQLIGAMEKRRQLQYAFEPMFAEKPLAKYTPRGDDSIYADLELG